MNECANGNASRRSTRRFLVFALALAVVVLTCVHRFRGSAFGRPFEFDEFITLRYYTWCGSGDDGSILWSQRKKDLARFTTPSPLQLAIGIYASLGRWMGPDNHVVNSFLINFTLPLHREKERSSRIPALVGSAVFALASVWLASSFTSSPMLLASIAALSMWFPYVVQYSQTARGYSWMLALITLHLLALRCVGSRPESIVRGTIAAAVAIALFMNTVNLLADWIVPVYCVFLAFPLMLNPGHSTLRRSIRRNLVIQSIGIGATSAVFVFDRLPYLWSSIQQYGIPFDGTIAFGRQLNAVFAFLFPSAEWIVLALASTIGFAFLWSNSTARYVFGAGVACVSFSVLHFILSSRLPYERNFGILLPFCVVGFAGFFDVLTNYAKNIYIRRCMPGIAMSCVAALIVLEFRNEPIGSKLNSFFTAVETLRAAPTEAAWYLRCNRVTPTTELYVDDSWKSLNERPPHVGNAQLLIFLHAAEKIGQSEESCACLSTVEESQWPRVENQIGPYRVVTMRGTIVDASSKAVTSQFALFLWYPPLELVTISPARLLNTVRGRLRCFRFIHSRYQAKLNVYARVSAVIVAATSSEEVMYYMGVFDDLISEHGGEVRVFIPR